MRITTLLTIALLAVAPMATADVELTEHRGIGEKIAKGEHAGGGSDTRGGGGGASLIDASGLEFFINTDVTFTTSESASGSASDATYTQAVAASTSGGGTFTTTLSDAFDGYNGLIVNGTDYNQNGPATPNAACSNRELLFNTQTIDGLEVSRRVFVPGNDEFIRFLDVITNPTGSSISVTVSKANNLGSDSDTVVDTSSSGDANVTTADLWHTSYEDYDTNGESFDPRLGHVYRGAGAAVGLASITGADTNNPAWAYEAYSVQPGETVIFANFVTGQPNRPDAATQAARLATLPAEALQCLSAAEQAQIVNFVAAQQPQEPAIPALDGWGIMLLVALMATIGVAVVRFLR
jgi:hypothetical protein